MKGYNEMLYLCYVTQKGYVKQHDNLLHWWKLSGISTNRNMSSGPSPLKFEQEIVLLTQLSVLLNNTY
jgi:hypothetical protein